MRSVRTVHADSLPEVTSVLCDAFADYPVMRYVLGDAETGDYPARLERLVGFFAAARVLRDDLILGVPDEAGLAAVALLTLPGDRPSPPALEAARERVWAHLGGEARGRYEAFGQACAPFTVDVPHLHLNMLAVRRRNQGQGLARLLLDRLHRIAQERGDSRGVTLTTEDARNLPLYRRFGYDLLGHARVAPELESWGFFRPLSP